MSQLTSDPKKHTGNTPKLSEDAKLKQSPLTSNNRRPEAGLWLCSLFEQVLREKRH